MTYTTNDGTALSSEEAARIYLENKNMNIEDKQLIIGSLVWKVTLSRKEYDKRTCHNFVFAKHVKIRHGAHGANKKYQVASATHVSLC
eukprot:746839-Hanusia_phi.AAC.7